MIPIILLSSEKEKIKKFIEKKTKELKAILIKIIPKKNEYSINDIKEISQEAHIFHKQVRIYLLEDFHFSSLPAQNAFLKVLEEPPANVQFILSTNNIYSLLPTIISRAKIIKLDKREEKTKEKPSTKAVALSKVINRSTNKIPFSLFEAKEKAAANAVFEEIIAFFRKRLSFDKNAPLIIKETLRVKTLLENNNLNSQLATDHLLIFINNCYNDYKR
ncbi:MAG: hypothetical protein ACK4FL_00550 [Microgenomates group bacterium]